MHSRIETAVVVDWPVDLDPGAAGPLWATVRYQRAEEREPGTTSVVIALSATRPRSRSSTRQRMRQREIARGDRQA